MTALLPGRVRSVAVCVLVCCAIFVGVVGAIVTRLQTVRRLDNAIDNSVQGAVGGHPLALHLIAGLGEKTGAGAMTVVLVLVCLAVRRPNGALLAAIAIPVGPAVTEYVLKPLFAGPDLDASFPSGHTTAAFAIATVIGVLLATPSRRGTGGWRLAITLAALLAAAAVGVAVIGLAMHTFTDTLGGAAVGGGFALLMALVLDLPPSRRLLTRKAHALRQAPRPVSGSPTGTSSRAE